MSAPGNRRLKAENRRFHDFDKPRPRWPARWSRRIERALRHGPAWRGVPFPVKGACLRTQSPTYGTFGYTWGKGEVSTGHVISHRLFATRSFRHLRRANASPKFPVRRTLGGLAHLFGRTVVANSPRNELSPDAQLVDEALVAREILGAQIVEQTAALSDQAEQSTPRMVVLRMRFEMFGELLDTGGEQGQLDFGCPRIVYASRVVGNDRAPTGGLQG